MNETNGMPAALCHRGRILCVTSNFPRWPGDSTTPFVLHLVRDLQKLGWQVDVLAPHAPGARRQEWIEGVRVERFCYFLPVRYQTVCYQGGAMVNLRKRPLERLKLPALVFTEWFAVWRHLLFRRYDLVHSHWILPQGFTGTLATIFPRKPYVVTVHGGDLFSLRGKALTALKWLTLQKASAVTVNSSFTEARTRELAPRLKNLHRIPMGVDTEELSSELRTLAAGLRSEYKRDDGPLLVFVGRIVEEKGLEDAIRAVALLRSSYPGTRLLVIGEGQDRPAMEQLAQDFGLADQVLFLGWVEPRLVRGYMAAADVFLGPSRTSPDGWVEAQGLTFLEAMAAGTPVVATRLGGIVDSVRHEETGLLVRDRAPEEIVAAVRRLIADPEMCARLVSHANHLVKSEFSRSVSAGAFSRLFESLIPLSNIST